MWACAVCGAAVFPDPENGFPASRYWIAPEVRQGEIKIVFCSGKCSLIYCEREKEIKLSG